MPKLPKGKIVPQLEKYFTRGSSAVASLVFNVYRDPSDGTISVQQLTTDKKGQPVYGKIEKNPNWTVLALGKIDNINGENDCWACVPLADYVQGFDPATRQYFAKAPYFPYFEVVAAVSKNSNPVYTCDGGLLADYGPYMVSWKSLRTTTLENIYWEKTSNIPPGTTPRRVFSNEKSGGCNQWDQFKTISVGEIVGDSTAEETYQLKSIGESSSTAYYRLPGLGTTVTFKPQRYRTRIVFNDENLNDHLAYDAQVERNIDIYKITAAQSPSNNTVVDGVAKWRSLGGLNNSTLNLSCKLQYETGNGIWKDLPQKTVRIVGNNGYEGYLDTQDKWSFDNLDLFGNDQIDNLMANFTGSTFLLPSSNSIKINLIRHTKLPTRIKFNKIENYYMGDVDRASSLTNSTTSGLRDLLGDGKIDLSVALETRSLLGQNWVTIDKSANIKVYATQNPSVQLPKTSSVDMKTQVDPNNKLISHKKLTFKAEFTPSGADVSIYDQCYTDDKFTWNRIEAGDGSRFYKTSAHGDVTPVSIMKVNNYQTLEITSCNTKGWSIELNKIQPVFVKPRTLFPNLITLTGKLNEFKPSDAGIKLSSGTYSIGKLNYEGSETAKGGFFRGRFEKSLLTTLSTKVSSQYLQITQKCTKCAFKIQMPENVPLLVDAPKAKPPTVASSLGFDESYSLKCLIDEEPIIRQINVTPAGQIHPKITAKEIPIEVRVWIDKNKNIIKN